MEADSLAGRGGGSEGVRVCPAPLPGLRSPWSDWVRTCPRVLYEGGGGAGAFFFCNVPYADTVMLPDVMLDVPDDVPRSDVALLGAEEIYQGYYGNSVHVSQKVSVSVTSHDVVHK